MSVPKGVRLVSQAVAILWFSWGFVEALIPIFLLSFTNSYAETGLLKSIFNISFLLTLPVAGMLADRVASRTLIIIGFLIYPLVGLNYFLAGYTGIVLFIVATRTLNGFCSAIATVGNATYIRLHTANDKISSAFGYFETVANSWWVVAVLASALIVPFLGFENIHWLFLGIIPASFISLIFILKLDADRKGRLKDGFRKAFSKGFYSGALKEVAGWRKGLKLMALLTFFLSFISIVGWFFIPIYAYSQGESLQQIVLLIAILTMPAVFGSYLGKIADKYKAACIFASLGMFPVLLFLLSLTNVYLLQLALVFGIGLALELIGLAGDGITTRITPREHYGRMESSMDAISSIGSLVSPVVLGLIIDSAGMAQTFMILGGVSLLVFLIALGGRNLISA